METQLKNLFEFDPSDCVKISAKTGQNVASLFDVIVKQIPPPNVDRQKPCRLIKKICLKIEKNEISRALIFDSTFDHFRGAIAYVLVKEGMLKKGQKIKSYHSDREYEISEVNRKF